MTGYREPGLNLEGMEPIPREGTAAIIAERIREAITGGRFRAGDQLAEATLAAAFGVSRGPVREATQRLLQEGLLRSEPNRGVFVISLDESDIRDVYEARGVVEQAALVRLLRAGDDRALAELRRCVDEMRRGAARGDAATVVRWDLEFHTALTLAAGSPRLTRMFQTLLAETRIALAAGGRRQLDAAVVEEHASILDALAAGDRRLALREVERHMRSGISRRIRTVPRD